MAYVSHPNLTVRAKVNAQSFEEASYGEAEPRTNQNPWDGAGARQCFWRNRGSISVQSEGTQCKRPCCSFGEAAVSPWPRVELGKPTGVLQGT